MVTTIETIIINETLLLLTRAETKMEIIIIKKITPQPIRSLMQSSLILVNKRLTQRQRNLFIKLNIITSFSLMLG